MNNFIFQKKFSFSPFETKIRWRYKTTTKTVIIKKSLFKNDLEFNFTLNQKKGNILIKDRLLSKTLFIGKFNSIEMTVEQTLNEISFFYHKKKYDFIFQKNLITGLFVGNKNVGIIRQETIEKFNLYGFFGFVESDVPEEIIILFLIIFQKTYAKENNIFYQNKGFTHINPRILCDLVYIEKINNY